MSFYPIQLEFQFLIGTLKTKGFWEWIKQEAGFQFLIGTLKTFPLNSLQAINMRFQFLIGTLKTRQLHAYRQRSSLVSIPHRYAENQRRGYNLVLRGVVSIPHRYAENVCTVEGEPNY